MPAAPNLTRGAVRSNVGFGRGDLLYGVDLEIVKAAAKRFDFIESR
jgi:hypothetical protein